MRQKFFLFLFIPFLNFFILNNAWGNTYPIYLRYQPMRELTSLQKKLGSTLGIAPFQDQRPDRLYIGHQTSSRNVSNYFKSDPFPLEYAIVESLSQALSQYGVKTVLISNWDGKPESLKNMEADSILKIEIKRFWTEGRAIALKKKLQTKLNTSIYLTICLGVKKEGKVFTRNVYVGKEMMVDRLTPEEVEQTINKILTDIFDTFFSNPF